MVIPMAGAEATYVPVYRDKVDHAAWDAARALGDLTRLANEAQTVSDALYVRERANDLIEAALGAVGVALTKADSF